jgi:tetratricopeptide (TPR) repeat protein
VAHICRLVDGMPLGVLLAAGWMRMLAPADIATEIEQSLDFLQTDLRDLPERQRSVRAVFDHSWRLLTDQEQDVLGQLSVFRGGFTRRAAQAVAGATLHELKGLVDKSLVDHTTTGRYQLHELLRQYAADRLRRADKLSGAPAALEAAHDRHGAYYAGFLARRSEQLKGPRQQAALAEIEADADNARAAWDWAVERGQVEWLDQGMEGLGLFYERTGRYEQGERACRRAAERLAQIGASAGVSAGYGARVQARALTWRAVYHDHLGRYESARQLLRSSRSLLDEPALADVDCRRERAFVLRQEGNVTMWLGEYERARRLFEHSLALYRELGDRWGTAIALVGLGWTAWYLDAFAEAEGWQREGLALRRALGDRTGIADALQALSSNLGQQGQMEESERLAREAITVARETASQVNLAWGLQALASALGWLGKFAEAESLRTEAKALWEDLGSRA